MNNGEIYSWGRGKHGVLGVGSSSEDTWFPIKIVIQDDMNKEVKISKVYAGNYHVFGIAEVGGALFAWGKNTYGQLAIDSN